MFGDLAKSQLGRGGLVIGATAGLWAMTHRHVGRHGTTERGRKQGILSTLTTGSLSAAAGYGVFRAAPPFADKGLQALRQRALLEKGKSTAFGAAEKLIAGVDRSSSFVQTLAGARGVALAAGLVAIPVAHRIAQRAFAGWSRHAHEMAYVPSTIRGQQGREGGRKESGWQPKFGGAGPAVVNTTGRLRTHYDAGRARKMMMDGR